MTSKLSLYNGALRELASRKLASLSERVERRRVMDSIWDDEAVRKCLAQGQWNFATNSIQLDHSPSVEPAFGFRFAFNKPENWVRTAAMCSDEYFKAPLLQYFDEGDYWYSDLDPIYVRYIDSGTSFGGDMAKWPPNFVHYVECFLAARAAMPITRSETSHNEMERLAEVALVKAKSSDAMDEATAFPPTGSWVRSRGGRRSGAWDRGSRNRLIG